MKNGGSVSHHHGVGKIRRDFMPGVVGPVGLDFLRGIKDHIDSTNVFASQNMFVVGEKS
jgi:alkyldihydroxyacetonephosphate synthase